MQTAKTFFVNGIILTTSSLIIGVISTFFNVYIANKVGSQAIGLFQLIMSIYTFFITIATSGINIASTHIISEQMAIGNNHNIKKSISQCIIYSFCFGLLSSIILFFSSDFIVNNFLQNKINSTPLYFICIALPFLSVCAAINGYFNAVRRAFKNATSMIVEQSTKIIASTFLVSLFLPDGIKFVCLALVIGDVISEIVSFIYTYFIFILDKKKYLNNLSRESSNFWGKIFKITIPVSISSYIRSGLNTLSQVLIPMRIRKSGISYEYSLSQYGIISGMVMPIILFASVFIRSFSGLLIPEFSNYNATQNYKRMSNVIKRSFNLTFIFSIVISGILWSFCADISNLFYKSTDISIFIKILSPLVVLIYIDNIIDSILKGLNKQTAVMVCNIVDLLVSISFIWFLLPIFGITGYIIVIFISELLNCSISFFELMRVTKFEFNLFGWIIKPAAAMLISNLFISVFRISAVNNILDLILNIGIYIGLYLVVLIRI